MPDTNNDSLTRSLSPSSQVASNKKLSDDYCKDALDYSASIQPMFSSLIPYFKVQLRICNAIGCCPFKWNEESKRLEVHESRTRLQINRLEVYLLIAYTLFITGYFFSPGSLKLNTLTDKLLGLVFLACFITTMCMSWTVFTKRSLVAQMCNTMLDVEQNYLPPPDDKKPKDAISKLLMILGVVTSGGLPGFMCMMLLVDPCKPPHLGYILFKESISVCAIPSPFFRIMLLLFDTFIWTISIAPACFQVFHGMFLGLRCLDQYLQLLHRGHKRKLTKIFRNQDHKNTVVFALYKRLQILGQLYNAIYKSLFIPSIVVVAIFVLIVCIYVSVRLHHVIPMPGFAFFPLLSMDGFSVIYIIKIAAGVFVQSSSFVATVRKSKEYGRKTLYKKQVRSFALIKIYFSETNFTDQKTPLVFLDFAFAQTVSLMLLTQETNKNWRPAMMTDQVTGEILMIQQLVSHDVIY